MMQIVSLYMFGIVLAVLSIVLKIMSPKILGDIGESRVRNRLLTLDTGTYFVLNNLYIPNGRGSTSQVDHVVVSPHGVFVIETKNYSGRIYGKETDAYWTVVNYKRKDRLKNPFHQNYGHIQSIKAVVGDDMDVPFVSMVVFANRADLRIEVKPRTELIYTRQLTDAIHKYTGVVLSKEKVLLIVDRLRCAQVTDKRVNRRHLESVRSTLASNKESVKQGICPRYGGQLVMRRGKYGTFLGCSNFPKCRFVQKGA